MTDTMNDNTVELVPTLRMDRGLLEELGHATEELRAVREALLAAMKRAHAVQTRVEAAVPPWPLSEDTDLLIDHVPGSQDLHNELVRIADIADAYEKREPDWSQFEN